jgi:ribosome assembly protein YihI (activator of Der GTPase)
MRTPRELRRVFRKTVRTNLETMVRNWRWPKTVTADELVYLETMLDNMVELLEQIGMKEDEED